MLFALQELAEGGQVSLQNTIGKKAESLVFLTSIGVKVPDGVCISTEGFSYFLDINNLTSRISDFFKHAHSSGSYEEKEADSISQAIINAPFPERLAQDLSSRLNFDKISYAVRSSGVKEDLQSMSFAGMYTSILNVRSLEEVFLAVKECWASIFSQRVLSYAQNKQLLNQSFEMGVIIQELIPAQKSGVVFTLNPVDGHDTEMIIEACWGLGEILVSGHQTPQQYRFDWRQNQITANTPSQQTQMLQPSKTGDNVTTVPVETNQDILSEDDVQKLAAISLSIQMAYGFPVDIEWAYFEGEFYIVQSRPITKFGYQAIKDEWTMADFKDGGVSSAVCTPFMWSLYEKVWEATLPAYLTKTRFLSSGASPRKWGNMFFGRPYWNLTGVKQCLQKLPGFIERDFDSDLGIQPSYDGSGYVSKTTPSSIIRGLRVLSALKKSFHKQLSSCKTIKDAKLDKLKSYDNTDWDTLSSETLIERYIHFIQNDWFETESFYFNFIFDNSNFQTLFKDALRNAGSGADYLTLISGLEDLAHIRYNCELWDLCHVIRKDNSSYSYWKETPSDMILSDIHSSSSKYTLPVVRTFISKYKYHSRRELDITHPRYDEDPTPVITAIKEGLSENITDPRKANASSALQFEYAKKQLLNRISFFKKKKIARAIEEARTFLWWREEIRNLSTRYYYHVRQLTLRVADTLVSDKKLKDRTDIFYLKIDQVIELLTRILSVENAEKSIILNKKYYASFRCFNNESEIGSRYVSSSYEQKDGDPSSKLKGIPCSPNVTTGTARIVTDIFDSDRIQKGDILITKFTDPGWTSKFSLISGIATEAGGMLSHAAVISREFGIPAVLGVSNVTTLIQDGATITLDGNAGTISLHKEESHV